MPAAKATFQLFVVLKGQPTARPTPARLAEIQGPTTDDLLAVARETAARSGRLRCVSFTPTGLVAYVEEAE